MRLTVKKRGYLLVLALIFGAVFFTMLTAFTGYVITQGETQESKYFKERALDIAEAGLNYYKWFLAHYPGDTTNGTGLPGPYVILA
jgi:regulator of protease activity HflC (stomatin/prohibitin superfamily)